MLIKTPQSSNHSSQPPQIKYAKCKWIAPPVIIIVIIAKETFLIIIFPRKFSWLRSLIPFSAIVRFLDENFLGKISKEESCCPNQIPLLLLQLLQMRIHRSRTAIRSRRRRHLLLPPMRTSSRRSLSRRLPPPTTTRFRTGRRLISRKSPSRGPPMAPRREIGSWA